MARLESTPQRVAERAWEIDFADFGFGSEDGLSPWIDATAQRPSGVEISPRARPEPNTGMRIAHVLASTDGIEDVEVSVVCPECQSKVLLDVTHEAAMQTALSLLHSNKEAESPASGSLHNQKPTSLSGATNSSEERARRGSWRARVPTIREELALLLMTLTVSDVMRTNPSAVRASARISSLSTMFTGDDLSGVIVVDEDDRPIGMITPAQLLRVVFSVSRERFEGLHVRNVMLSRMFCVRMDAPLSRAMELFNQQAAMKVAVVGEDGKLSGVVSPAELVKFLEK